MKFRWTIGRKLLLAFLSVSAVTALVGGVGYFGVNSGAEAVDEIGVVRLPSVGSLGVIARQAEVIRVAMRSLGIAGLPPEIRQRQYDNIAKSREVYGAAAKEYEALPQTFEEAEAWKQFNAAWDEWRKDNDKFLELCQAIDAQGISDPDELLRDLFHFRGDHYKLAEQVLHLLHTKEEFAGGDDHTACNFGKWLPTFKSENPAIAAHLRDMTESHQRYHGAIRKLKQFVREGDVETAYTVYNDEINVACEKTLAHFDAMVGIANGVLATHHEAQELLLGSMTEKQRAAVALLDRVVELNHDAAEATVKTNQEYAGILKTATLGAVVGGVALAMLLGLLITRSISRPVVLGVKFAETVAGGNLTEQLDIHRSDEIGTLAEALNGMAVNLRQVMQDIGANAQTLAGASTELSATATQLAGGAEETTNQSATVASAAEEMSTNMQHMAASTEQMSNNVKSVSAAIEEMTASITEVARNAEEAASVAENAAQLAQTSNDNIGQLGAAADAIGKVIETIQDIAEQTNLLALNATIEAARAGEAGKGFAVVANEVKELAKQSAEAADDIRRRIEGIQGSTGQAVGSIGEISRVIQRVREVSRTIAAAVEEQSVTTKEIARNVAETASAAETVAASVGQSATAAQEITRNIAGVDQAARQAAAGASQTQTASGELSRLGEQLKELVGRFKCA